MLAIGVAILQSLNMLLYSKHGITIIGKVNENAMIDNHQQNQNRMTLIKNKTDKTIVVDYLDLCFVQ